MVVRLESSSKWPDDLEAVRSTGTAFLIRLAQCLEKQVHMQEPRDFMNPLAQPLLASYYLATAHLSIHVFSLSANTVPCCIHLVILPLTRLTKEYLAAGIKWQFFSQILLTKTPTKVRNCFSQKKTRYAWFGSRTLIIFSVIVWLYNGKCVGTESLEKGNK